MEWRPPKLEVFFHKAAHVLWFWRNKIIHESDGHHPSPMKVASFILYKDKENFLVNLPNFVSAEIKGDDTLHNGRSEGSLVVL